jgi:hypothetical protein
MQCRIQNIEYRIQNIEHSCSITHVHKITTSFPLVQDDGEEEEEEEEEEVIQFSTEEQLDMLVEYLRSQHRYCLFCAIRKPVCPSLLQKGRHREGTGIELVQHFVHHYVGGGGGVLTGGISPPEVVVF